MSEPGPAPGRAEGARRSRERAYLMLSLVAALVLPVVWLLGGHSPAQIPAALALAVEALVLLTLAATEARRAAPWLRDPLLFAAAAATAPVGWFFGPSGGIAALIALLVLLAGLLGRPGSRASLMVYGTLAAGQLAVVVLVLLRVLPDASLAEVRVAGHPDWQHLFAHLAIQGVHLGSFLAGRVLQARYAEVRAELARAHREAATKAALLDEARQDYRRAMRALKKGALSRQGVVRTSEPPPPPSPSPTPSPSPSPPSDDLRPIAGDGGTHATRLFFDAYRVRMERQHLGTLGLTLGGSIILLVIGRDPTARLVGLVGMAGIAGLTLVQRGLGRRGSESSYWPWTLIALASVAPAYAFGLHSAFSCVVAALLFFGGFFRAAPGAMRVGRRLPVYVAVALGHAVVFALVLARVLPDAGNLPILPADGAALRPIVLHGLLQAIYFAAFAGGWALDTRLDVAIRQAATAEKTTLSRTDAILRTGAAIDRALEGTRDGLFTGERVGSYAVGRLLASGAMGDVYEAQGPPGVVALKLVRADHAEDPVALELLAREAGALARVRSERVAKILEAGVDQELPYVAMELIEGESLADVLRERGRLPLARARELADDLLAGVRDVHDAGVIHRDLKPHNVMRTVEGRWKIVDFGLAAVGLGPIERRGGTAAYMAPEQAEGGRVDLRADLFATASILYRALTGRPAFVDEDRRQPPPDPRALADVSAELAAVLAIGLALDPKERFATAREMRTAVLASFDGRLEDRHRERAERLSLARPWSD